MCAAAEICSVNASKRGGTMTRSLHWNDVEAAQPAFCKEALFHCQRLQIVSKVEKRDAQNTSHSTLWDHRTL